MQTGTLSCPPDQIPGVGTVLNGNNMPISGIPPSQPVMMQQQTSNNNPGQNQITPQASQQGSLSLPIIPDGTQQFCLRWNSYPATVATQLATLRASEDFVDVTLACEGRQLRAHKLVLSACSPYFMQLFKSTPCKHPVIFLRDVGFRQLVALLEFMYAGEVNVSQTELPTLLRTAEALQVRGLADTNTNNNSINDNNNYQNQIPPKNIFNPIQQYPTAPIMLQTTQNFPPVSTQSVQPTVPQQATPIPPHPQPQQHSQSTDNSQQQLNSLQQQSSDSVMQSTSSGSPKQPKSHKRRKNSISGQASGEADDSSSDSNYSPEVFTELKPPSKVARVGELSAAHLSNSTANPIEMTNSMSGSLEQSEQDRQNPLMEFDGIGNLGGSQSEEETSEEEDLDDDDDDDGEIKEFYQSDGSYNLDPNDEGEASSEMIAGTSTGNSGAAPLGIKNPELGSSSLKDEAAIADKVQRSRLSRSLWPPGLPYHGPQQCPYCPRVLSNVGNWRKHVVTMHFAREKTYKCKHCNSSFRTAEYLQKHYVRVHNYPPKMTRKKYVEQT